MAKLLKEYYNKDLIQKIGRDLNEAFPDFNNNHFLKSTYTPAFLELELKDRMHHIADNMGLHLKAEFPDQVKILSQIVQNYVGLQGMIFPDFIERNGIEHYKTSIHALKHFTTYSTSEFAIRPFIIEYPETIVEMQSWTTDKNFHVRRLASEGSRPLLPWAQKLPKFVVDPSPILPILHALKDDKEDYVYRSVANNLNDISKNHPELAISIAEQWIGSSKSADWAAKHALRTQLKKGNLQAMKLFGFGDIKNLNIQRIELQDWKITIGDATQLLIQLLNGGKTAKFRIEYAVHYLKKNGSHSEKVFQIAEKEIMAGEVVTFDKKCDFKDLSTRKHYAGEHFICLIINGIRLNKLTFELVK